MDDVFAKNYKSMQKRKFVIPAVEKQKPIFEFKVGGFNLFQ
jgi:c-di-GMP-related signal transduction protein